MKLALQAFALRQHYPDSTIDLSTRGLVWCGELTPSPLSETYLVSMVAESGDLLPDMFVLSPALEADDQGRLPHVWSDGALCLSRSGEWRRDFFFIDTIVPWTAEWLFHYEIWRGSGIWMGDDKDATVETTSKILHRLDPDARRLGRRCVPQAKRKLNVQAL